MDKKQDVVSVRVLVGGGGHNGSQMSSYFCTLLIQFIQCQWNITQLDDQYNCVYVPRRLDYLLYGVNPTFHPGVYDVHPTFDSAICMERTRHFILKLSIVMFT